MGLASRGGTPLQDLALRRIPGAPGQNLDPGLNPGEFASFTSSSSSSQVTSLSEVAQLSQFCFQSQWHFCGRGVQRGVCGFRIGKGKLYKSRFFFAASSNS